MAEKVKMGVEIEWDNPKFWINSDPLNLEKLKGKVVLLDFWTYSCVNCIRTIPHLTKMWEKYKNKRFVLIGIHTPEFEFEKEIGNVKYAVKKYGIKYPILSDPLRANWENYGNTYWPRCALIDSEGKIVFEHVGESGYDEVERMVVKELAKLREVSSDFEPLQEQKKNYPFALSKETYAGKARNENLGSGIACVKEGCNEYVDNGGHVPGIIYLQGMWKQQKEFLEYRGKEQGGWINFKYYATEVNVVLSGVGIAEILLDGAPIGKSDAGKDILFQDGRSFVKLEGPDMYNLVKHENYQQKLLTIRPFSEMKVYAYTFG